MIDAAGNWHARTAEKLHAIAEARPEPSEFTASASRLEKGMCAKFANTPIPLALTCGKIAFKSV